MYMVNTLAFQNLNLGCIASCLIKVFDSCHVSSVFDECLCSVVYNLRLVKMLSSVPRLWTIQRYNLQHQ